MLETRSLALADEGDYEIIESAVMESARGRRFLTEYARRNRGADTEMLLGAIGRLENTVARERVGGDVGRLRGDLMEMAQAISRTRAEIAAIQPPDQDHSRLTAASEALDAIVRSTETATSDILSAAEEIQEATWTLREAGASATLCDELDRRATQIYTACSFQDLTAQRTSRVVHTLRYLEERIASMIAIWGQRLDEVPPPAPGQPESQHDEFNELCQSDVDRVLQTDALPHARGRVRPAVPVPLDDDVAFVAAAPTGSMVIFEEAGPADDMVEPFAPAYETVPEPEAEAAFDDAPEPPAANAQVTNLPEAFDDDLALAFGDLDTLSIEEKLALFA